MASKTQITNIVETLSKVYGKEPGDMSGFYWALEDTSYDTLLDAAREYVKNNKWMPAPSELRELCVQAEAERQKQDEPRRIRQYAYELHDRLRDGEITEEQFTNARATQWVYRQYGIFSGLFAED